MADPLTDVLGAVRLTGGVFLDARFTAPWCLLSGISPEFCQVLNWSPAQVIAYHYVIAGRMIVGIAGGGPSVEVAAGQIVLLPRNDNHLLSSATGLMPVDAASLVADAMVNGFARITHGGGGAETHIVCGYLGTEGGYNPLIETLPPLLKVGITEGVSRDWVESSLRFAASELSQGRVATSGIMAKLSEILFVEAVRQHAAEAGEGDLAWLKGMRDPQIGRALALIHRDIARAWTADELAREAALSRSAFMERFTRLVGLPPARYAILWRLRTARLSLRETTRTIAQIAYAVGYESEEAFSRAFKREFGTPPAQFRLGTD